MIGWDGRTSHYDVNCQFILADKSLGLLGGFLAEEPSAKARAENSFINRNSCR
jgi:hypothetical protein